MSSTFRLRFGEYGYPISRLVVDRARALGLSRSDLARRLGYRPIGSAHRALGEALRTGTVPAHMRKHLADALALDKAVIDSVIEATSHQKQDQWRTRLLAEEREYVAHFQPHLRTETARTVPQPIFIAALIGTARFRLVELPAEVWEVSTEDRDRLVKQDPGSLSSAQAACCPVRRDPVLYAGDNAGLSGRFWVPVRHRWQSSRADASGQAARGSCPRCQARR
jgi:hypothetical protein